MTSLPGSKTGVWKFPIRVVEVMCYRTIRTGFLGAMVFLTSYPLWAELYNNPAYDTTGYGVETLDERVAKLEKQLTGSTLLEMFNNLDRLQAEVSRLGGQIEELNHEIESVRKQQRDMYADIDQRLQASRTMAPGATLASTPEETAAPDAVPVKNGQEGAIASPRSPATPPVTAGSNNESAVRQAAYQKAFNLLKDSKYPEAIKELKAFISSYPGGEFSDNAWYWLGEAQYVSGEKNVARDTFRDMIKKYPQSSKAADALLKIAYIEYDVGQYANAKDLLNEVVKRYPASSAARMAEKRLEKIKSEKH
ncbi:tol-pal system protein YbgF [Candidatus Woesearchaeota archaeon]|nr:tol-pal system protein YbgF [Candidatus Woesearchaeota archaeon]